MGLTQITTKGIIDASIATVDLANDSVDESKLAEDSVGAPHLDTAATGSNGQFLKKDDTGAGGITWDAVPAGVGGANGADLNDDVKIRFGTGNDLEIYHDGGTTHHTWLKDDGIGDFIVRKNNATNLKLQGNAVYLQSGAGTATYLSGANGGAVEINYNNNKKFETTSSGINVTGAITVNGSALSSLPTIDLVADGAIAAGKAVCLTSAGKAEQVRYVASMQTTPSIYIGPTELDTNGCGVSRSCWDPDLTSSLSKGVFWNIYQDGGDGDKVKLFANTNDGWPQNKGDVITLNTGDGSEDDVAIDYDTQNDKIITAYSIDGALKARTITATNITTANITANTEVDITSTGESIAMAYGTSGKFLLMYSNDSGSVSHYCKVCTVASDGTISQGTAVEFASSTDIEYPRCVYAPELDKFLILYTKSSDSNNAYCRVATISGTSVSFGTEAEFCGDDCDGIAAAWDSKNEKFAILYNGANDYLYGKVGTVSGTSISFGSGTQISGNYAALRPEVAFSKLSNSFVTTFRNPNNTGGRLSAKNFAIDGTGFDVKSGEGANLSPQSVNKPYGLVVSQVVMGTGPDIVAHYTTRDQATHLQVARLNFLEPGSNLISTKANFIGFAPSAVSNGATGTFHLSGNTIGSQSGLTAGTGYAVQNDGTLGGTLTNSNVGLLALTSTTGLIKGY